MKVIGIAGGVASGKSLVADCLARLGAKVIDADRVAHQVLQQPEVREAIARRWGRGVLTSDGQVDRAALGRIVFAPPPDGPHQLAQLEQLTHPRIERQLARCLAQLREKGGTKAAVLDAAVMFKAGWDRLCDIILFVEAPRPLRQARARQRGWSEAEFAAREAAQQPLEAKRRRADLVVDNSGTPEQTMDQLRQFWQQLD